MLVDLGPSRSGPGTGTGNGTEGREALKGGAGGRRWREALALEARKVR